MKNLRNIVIASGAALCASISLNTNAVAQTSSSNSTGITDFKVFGRFMMDYTIADTENAGVDINTSQVRRARLGASGKYAGNLKFKIEFNSSDDGEIEVTDGYVEWQPSKAFGGIRVGHFKTPNSLEEETSSKYLSTLERSALTDAFSLNRRLGIAWLRKSEHSTLFVGAYGENANADAVDEGYALAARATYLPVLSKDVTVHTGVSIRYREQGGDTGATLRYRQRPYSEATGRIISTGTIAESDTFIGLEAAALYKKFWTAAEYAQLEADCPVCTNDPSFSGYYLEAGMFLGGNRTYKDGKFKAPKIYHPVTEGGLGAVSLVARYDTIDLVDSGIDGGEQETIVLGANWWLSSKVRLGVNYYRSDNELGQSTSGLDPAFAPLVGSLVNNEQVDGFLIRGQFEF